MRFNFPVIVIDEDYRSRKTRPGWASAPWRKPSKEGLQVLGVTSYGDMSSFAQQQSRGSAFILSIDDEEFSSPTRRPKGHRRPARLRQRNPLRNADIPIFLHGETRTSATSPTTCCGAARLHHMCTRTRRSSSPATWCAKPRPTSNPCRRRSSAR